MSIPNYFLSRPATEWDEAILADFERLYARDVEAGTGRPINYDLSVPKWQFLCYLCDCKNIVLHGSKNADIAEFEPRKADDIEEFGNRQAVYAATDGIWPLYFAIVNRDNGVTSLVNGCFCVLEDTGGRSEPYYFFSINGDALTCSPWRAGTVYLLPRDTFEPQPMQFLRGKKVEVAQWASLVPVRPLAKLTVEPQDFPFLAQVHSHDPETLRDRAQANPGGFPWLEDG